MTRHIVDLLIRETLIISREEIMSLINTGIKHLITRSCETVLLIHIGIKILITKNKEIMYQIVIGKETLTINKDETA